MDGATLGDAQSATAAEMLDEGAPQPAPAPSSNDCGGGSSSAAEPDTGGAAKPLRLSKAEKKARRKLLHIQKKKEWRERRKHSAQQRSQDNAAALATYLASLDDAAREAFLAADKARRDKLYHDKVAQTARIDAALSGGLRVVLDLSYGDKMSDKEQTSLARQLARCWGVNRKAPAPVSLHLASLASCPPGCLPHNKSSNDIDHWKVHKISGDVADAFPHEQLIFLSPDADEPVSDTLDPKAVYIIGGLVDSSVQKRTSLQKAAALGAKVQRLPLAEYAPGASARLPLTLTAVLQILLALNNGSDWPTALTSAIAARHLRARTWENGRSARRQESRAKAAVKWGVEPKKPPDGSAAGSAAGRHDVGGASGEGEDGEEFMGDGEEEEDEDEDEEDEDEDEDEAERAEELRSEQAFLAAMQASASQPSASASAPGS